MSRLRHQKQLYANLLRTYCANGYLTQEEADTFDTMLRKCRSQAEQAELMKVVRDHLDAWKTGQDAHSRLLRDDLLGEGMDIVPLRR